MGIIGLTTNREANFPRIGVLRKGGKKPADGKKPGQDLKYFRFDTSDKDAERAFVAFYGAEPDTINVFLPYVTPDENFQAWQEEYRAGGLVHRCDGEIMSIWLTPDGKYSTEPTPCPYHTGKQKRTTNEPGCKAVGRLIVIVPELSRFAYVTVGTTSKNDIMELTDNLNAVFAIRGSLQGIPFILCRRPRMISTPKPDGSGRARYEKWMLSLEVNPKWATLQLEAMQKQAYLPTGVRLLTDGRPVDVLSGEILDSDEDDYAGTTITSLDDVEALDPNPSPASAEWDALVGVPAGVTATDHDGNKAVGIEKVSPAVLKRLHAVGTEAYGDDWDAKRHELVDKVSAGAANSSSDLTPREALMLISGMEKKIAAVKTAAVPA